jgi:hypothetical protein
MIAMILSAGGFWISDDIAIVGVVFLAFFLGKEVGEKRR